jgi:hypothetical protein
MKRFVFALSHDASTSWRQAIACDSHRSGKNGTVIAFAVIAFTLPGRSRFLYLIFCSGNNGAESFLFETMCKEAFILAYVQASQVFAHVLVHVHVDVLVQAQTHVFVHVRVQN